MQPVFMGYFENERHGFLMPIPRRTHINEFADDLVRGNSTANFLSRTYTRMALMHISFPLGILGKLVKRLGERIATRLVAPTLAASHQSWTASRRLGAHWRPLDPTMDFSLFLPTEHFENDKNATATIAFRNQGERSEPFWLCVKAKRGSNSQEETKLISELDLNEVRIVKLPNIPKQDLDIIGNRIFCSYNQLSIAVAPAAEVATSGWRLANEQSLTPIYNEYLNGHFVRWGGFIFNTDAIAERKLDIRHSILFRIGGPMAPFLRGTTQLSFADSIRGRFARALAVPVIVNAIFWVPIVLRLRRFDPPE